MGTTARDIILILILIHILILILILLPWGRTPAQCSPPPRRVHQAATAAGGPTGRTEGSLLATQPKKKFHFKQINFSQIYR